MPRMPDSFSAVFDEGDLRRRCGAGTFARAAALQSAGHVLGPMVAGSSMRAKVRGTWRRIEQVTIGAQAGRFVPTCSCGATGCCRHAGAVLLQWLRDPASFVSASEVFGDPGAMSSVGDVVSDLENPAWMRDTESPRAELARLLGEDTLPHLRQVARRWKLSVTRNKGELIAALATALAEPGAVDGALAALDRDESLALDAAQLVSVGAPVDSSIISDAVQALGGSPDSPSISALLDRGLLVAGSNRLCAVPRVVASRQGTIGNLARAVDTRKPARPAGGGDSRSPVGGLDIGATFQVIARSVAGGEVRRRRPANAVFNVAPTSALEWHVVDDQRDAAPAGNPFVAELTRRHHVRLVPTPPLLADADLQRASGLINQPTSAIAFAAHLMDALGLLEGADRLSPRADRLDSWHRLANRERLSALIHAWVSLASWTELSLVVGDGGSVHFRCDLTLYFTPPSLWLQAGRLRRLVANLIGRMEPDVWYDLASFHETVHRLIATPRLGLAFEALVARPGSGRRLWWFADAEHPEQALDLESTDGWTKVYGALITGFLTGPLSWLGLVDVVDGEFRVKPVAGLIREREVPDSAFGVPLPLEVDPDLTVTVPFGSSDAATHAMLARAGELFGASNGGLRYRLTAERARDLFDRGTNGDELVHLLDERSDGKLHDAARATLERWWTGYGSIRLYDDLTLIELGDDLLLSELLATSSLARAVVQTFSPRLVAVESTAVEAFVGELTRLGHVPRVVEEG